MKQTIVAIHQPNFFPWLGYFDKIARADVFCLLDDVQISRKGGTWSNRVQLSVSGEKAWVTAPIDRAGSGTQSIAETRFRSDEPWRRKLIESLRSNYGRAAYFDEAFGFVTPLVEFPEDDVTAYNEHAIRAINAALGLDTPLVRSSTLETRSEGTERLIEITRALGGTAYMCGGGAGGYQQDELFAECDVELIEQSFEHPAYSQGDASGFCAGLSVIDALMHRGAAGTRRLIGDV